MAPNPMNAKQSAANATTHSQDARLLVRETLRISANLASTPLLETASECQRESSGLRSICWEEIDGRRWKYVAEVEKDGSLSQSPTFKNNSFRPLSLQSPQPPLDVSIYLPSSLSLLLLFHIIITTN